MSTEVEPKNYEEVVKDHMWVQAMKHEIAALEDNDTWKIVKLPPEKKAIGCKCVFKIKYKASGEVERFKARLVAKGYRQTEGIDYQETFSAVVKMVTVRTVFAITAAENWMVYQLDVFNAFLQGDLFEEMYINMPKGFSAKGEQQV